jgi:SAM-dependent methyltransferase
MSEEEQKIYYKTQYYGEYQPKPSPEQERIEDPRGAKIRDDIFPYIEKSSAVLEIGCGTGENLMALRNRGFSNLTGLDPSPDCCSIVRSYGINCISSTLLSYALDSKNHNVFDLIILSHMLEHFVEPDASLRLIRNLLRENALVYILVPNLYGYTGQDPCSQFTLPHTFYFSINTLKALLSNNGFVLEQRFSSNEDEIAVLARKPIKTDIPKNVENEYDRAIKYLKNKIYINFIKRAWRARRRIFTKLLKTG